VTCHSDIKIYITFKNSKFQFQTSVQQLVQLIVKSFSFQFLSNTSNRCNEWKNISGQMDFGRLSRQLNTIFMLFPPLSLYPLFVLFKTFSFFFSICFTLTFWFFSYPFVFLLMLYWMKECHRVWKHVLTKSPPSTDSIATSFFKSKPLSKNNYENTHWNVNPKKLCSKIVLKSENY